LEADKAAASAGKLSERIDFYETLIADPETSNADLFTYQGILESLLVS